MYEKKKRLKKIERCTKTSHDGKSCEKKNLVETDTRNKRGSNSMHKYTHAPVTKN